MRSFLFFILGGTAAFLTTAGITYLNRYEIFPARLDMEISPIKSNYQAGENIPAQISLRSRSRRTLQLQVEARGIGPTQSHPLGKSNLILAPQNPGMTQSFVFPTTLESTTGPYRLNIQVTELVGPSILGIIWEGERSFWLSSLPPPPPPPVEEPAPKPTPRARKKTGPPKLEAEFLQPRGEYDYGDSLPVRLRVVNQGLGAALFRLTLSSDEEDFFSRKSLGPFQLQPQAKTVLKEDLLIQSTLPEGTYSLTALLEGIHPNSLPSVEVETSFTVADRPPEISFSDPPLSARVGMPVRFRLRASDDLEVKNLLFFLIQPGFSDFQMVPMEQESGDNQKGAWFVEKKSLPVPGMYSFYAQAEDSKGQKVRTKELKLVVR